MTAILLQANSLDQTIAQGVPTMRGRCLISFNNGLGSYGTFASSEQGIGWADEVPFGEFSAAGFSYQYPYFEASASGGGGAQFAPEGRFIGSYGGQSGVFGDMAFVRTYGCGELGIAKGGSLSSTNYEAIVLLSGMTLRTKAGYIPSYGGTGNYSVTGLGFKPDLVLFLRFGHSFWGETGVIIADRAAISFGASDGVSQWSMSAESGMYLLGGPRYSRFTESHVASATNIAQISFVSMDADGFTLNWNGPNDHIIEYLAIHDPVGQFKVGTGTEGDTSITPGFPAEFVLFGSTGVTVLDTDVQGASIGMGGSDNQLNQRSGLGTGGDLYNYLGRWSQSCVSMSSPTATVPTFDAEAVTTAFNPTTVDLNWTTGGGGGRLFGWVAGATSPGPGFGGCPQVSQIYRRVIRKE